MEYYIFTTNNCNLNCEYCSILLKNEEKNIPQTPIYSLNNLNHFIDVTQRQFSDSTADIIFFGGEPTLNYPFIQSIIEIQSKLKNLPYEFHYMLHTNGLLLSQIPTDVLFALDSIMLSINYDKVPRNQLHTSYFKTILDGVHYIKKARNIPVVARFTITEETSLYSEIVLFNSFFDAIYWQLENKYNFKNYSQFYSSYKYELELTFKMWLNYLKRGYLINLIPFIASTFFLLNEQDMETFCCGYNRSMVYIQTNGVCYTCAEDMTTAKNLIGRIEDKLQFDSFNVKDTMCSSCMYINMCLGRCGRMHREFKQEHIQEYCNLNHVMFNLIKDYLDEICEYFKKYKFILSIDDPIYHFTEYTP